VGEVEVVDMPELVGEGFIRARVWRVVVLTWVR
jgi:hypothetical protein